MSEGAAEIASDASDPKNNSEQRNLQRTIPEVKTLMSNSVQDEKLNLIDVNLRVFCMRLQELIAKIRPDDLALIDEIALFRDEQMTSKSSWMDSDPPGESPGHLQLKLDFEIERRVRIQSALDDAEKRSCAANRALERKSEDMEELDNAILKLNIKHEADMSEIRGENEGLTKSIREKEKQIRESEKKARYLTIKAQEFEDLFKAQLEVVKTLQTNLNMAYEENKALVKEMEMLNAMFTEMERSHVEDALRDYETSEVDLSDTNHKDEKGKEVGVHDLLQAVNNDTASSKIQESCFKEVVTKNGTKMVLSVSKTFMKLKDLILEKKTLEDQLEKMKKINHNLSTKVNTHEVKLFNITDELNKTWDYVSTLKWHHHKLHTSEQILRAELLEKRQLLAKLREELEFSRQNWILVKQKTADSEREWRALRDEFAARRQMFNVTSSESGFSDNNQTEEEESPDPPSPPKLSPSLEESQDIRSDPMPNEGNEISVRSSDSTDQIDGSVDDTPVTVFIPSMEYLTNVPEGLIPPIFDHQEKQEPTEEYQEIYSNLIASSERSAELATRLAEVNRTLGDGDDEITVSTDDDLNDDEDDEDDDDDDDVEPRTDADDEELVIESPDIISDVPDFGDEERDEDDSDTSDVDSDYSLEEPFPQGYVLSRMPSTISDCSSIVNASSEGVSSSQNNSPIVWDQEQAEEDASDGREIPEPPPPPTFSLVPPSSSVTVNPVYANMDSQDDSSEDERDHEADLESSTNVTRLLIKHLPKQMAKLRHDKAELEDKIQDLEARISQQAQSMSEMERRSDIFRRDAEQANAIIAGNNADRIRGAACPTSRIIPLVSSQSDTEIRWICSEAISGCKVLVTRKLSWSDAREEIVVSSRDLNDLPLEISFKTQSKEIYFIKIIGPPGESLDSVKFNILFE